MCTKIDTVPDVGHGLLIASGESLADKIGAVAFHACSALKNIGCDAIMESVARMGRPARGGIEVKKHKNGSIELRIGRR